MEARTRDWQGRHDRLAARLSQVEADLAAARGAVEPGVNEPGFDPETFAANLEERFARRAELREAAVTLRSQFGYADEELYRRAHEFDSVDALSAALDASHARTAQLVEQAVAGREATLRAEISAKYGVRFETPVDGGQAPAGDPTIEQLNAMSFREQAEYDAANPGVIGRVLRQASPA